MKVILLENIRRIGSIGDIIDVKRGFARNYLIANKKGNYIHFKIKGSGKIIKELEKNESIDKNLLRYLTVKVKKFDLETNYFDKIEEKNKKIEKNQYVKKEKIR